MNWKRWFGMGRGPVSAVGATPATNPFGAGQAGRAGGWMSRLRSSSRRGGRDRILRSPEQLEMILGAVKPVRNSLLDDDVVVVRRKADSRLIFESQPMVPSRVEEESDRAWQRLRGRRLDHLKVSVD